MTNIMVIDDEAGLCRFLKVLLTKEGYNVKTYTDPEEAIVEIKRNPSEYPVLLVDIFMPELSGIEFLKEIRENSINSNIIFMTAYASVETAVEALRLGAFDYINKPFKIDEVKGAISRALIDSRRTDNIPRVTKEISDQPLDKIVGTDKSIVDIKNFIKKIAPTDSTVLITGESGTGKNIIASALHQLSNRADKKFISINCAALPENLLESELFGYSKGAFTGANKDKEGLLKAADGGTFCLDEIGELQPSLQAKLLKVLEDKSYIPIGSTKTESVDIRLIASTNADLQSKVEQGEFRADLFYRINIFSIEMPPLRKRVKDIPLLVEHFLEKKKSDKKISEEALKVLINAHWSGNVRELENVIEQTILLTQNNIITPKDLPDYFQKEITFETIKPSETIESVDINILCSLENMERAYIFWVLTQTNWNKQKTSEILGIDLSTLYRKISKYGLTSQNDISKN